MHQFHAVIFDMDGLLLDTERLALVSFLRTCDAFGIGARTDVFARCLGVNSERGQQVLAEGFAGCVDHLEFGLAWEQNHAASTLGMPAPLKPGAAELLDHLSRLGIPTAVATSTRTDRAREKLSSAGILASFQAVVGGDQVENSKPHPGIYLRAAEILDVGPGTCLALEDSDNGVRAATSAGMTVLQIPDLVQPSADVLTLGHTVLASLHEVIGHAFSRPEGHRA